MIRRKEESPGARRAEFRARPRGLSKKQKGGNPVKVKPSVKKICEKCKIIKRHGHVMVICENPKHKQRQG